MIYHRSFDGRGKNSEIACAAREVAIGGGGEGRDARGGEAGGTGIGGGSQGRLGRSPPVRMLSGGMAEAKSCALPFQCSWQRDCPIL